mgnify:CR=1 FL=1
MLNNQNYPLIDWQHHAATALPFTSLWVAGGQHELKLVHFEWGKETWETLLSDGDSDTDTHTDRYPASLHNWPSHSTPRDPRSSRDAGGFKVKLFAAK